MNKGKIKGRMERFWVNPTPMLGSGRTSREVKRGRKRYTSRD